MFKRFRNDGYDTAITISTFKDYYEYGKTHNLDTVSVYMCDLWNLIKLMLTDKEIEEFKGHVQELQINYLYRHLPIDQNKKGGDQE